MKIVTVDRQAYYIYYDNNVMILDSINLYQRFESKLT